MRRILVAATLVLLPFATARAEMSADDLIGQLRLHPGGPTRGIHALASPIPTGFEEPGPRYRAAAASARSPVRAAPPAAAPQGQASLTVQFENGSDKLTPAATRTLDTLGAALASPDLAGDKFRIVGHTDSVGRPQDNQVLSERRAATVVAYIADRFKVDPARLVALGVGQAQPLVPTAAGVPEPQNRRVQVINLGS